MKSLNLASFILILVSFKTLALEIKTCESTSGLDSQINDLVSVVNIQPGCPSYENLLGICGAVANKGKKTIGTTTTHAYKDILYKAACIDPKDTEDKVKVKLEQMWSKFETKITCDVVGDVPNGSLIKVGVLSYYDEFIEHISTLKINFNRVDDSDKMTVLDYIQSKINEEEDPDLKARLELYYDQLKKAGAKLKSEL